MGGADSMSWILHGMAPDGSSWGYTDEQGKIWWCSTSWPARPSTLDGLIRYARYAGWIEPERTFESQADMLGHLAKIVAQNASGAAT